MNTRTAAGAGAAGGRRKVCSKYYHVENTFLYSRRYTSMNTRTAASAAGGRRKVFSTYSHFDITCVLNVCSTYAHFENTFYDRSILTVFSVRE